MSGIDPAFDRELRDALHEVDLADVALTGDIARLRAHAGRIGSYGVPIAVAGGLVASRLLQRVLRQRRSTHSIGAAAPAKAGIVALLMRLALPSVIRLARRQAAGWPGGPHQRPGFARPDAGVPPSAPALPRVSATLDRARFAGRWFEVATIQGARARPGTGTPSLKFVPVPEGFDVTREARVPDARRGARVCKEEGVLRPTDPAGHPSQLSLSFAPSWARWAPMAWSDYWILQVDNAYTFALVGDRARRRLVVLSRMPAIDEDVLRQLMRTATEEGYPVEQLVRRTPVG